MFSHTGTLSTNWCCCLSPLWLYWHRRPGCRVQPGRWWRCRPLFSSWTPWYLSLACVCCWRPTPCCWALLVQMACCFVLARCLSSLRQLLCSVASHPAGIHHFSERQNPQEFSMKKHLKYNQLLIGVTLLYQKFMNLFKKKAAAQTWDMMVYLQCTISTEPFTIGYSAHLGFMAVSVVAFITTITE